MSEALGLFIDVAVLIALGVMIFYAMRLSESLKEFRSQKHSFDGVIADLLSAIDQAERSIHNLKQVSSSETAELSDLIRKAKLLSAELKDVNQASESMASRLENLAEKNRKVMQGVSEPKVSAPAYQPSEPKAKAPLQRNEYVKPDLPSFMIQDRDFEDLDALGERLDGATSNDVSGYAPSAAEDMPKGLQSQAEKELYDALVTSKRNNIRGR